MSDNVIDVSAQIKLNAGALKRKPTKQKEKSMSALKPAKAEEQKLSPAIEARIAEIAARFNPYHDEEGKFTGSEGGNGRGPSVKDAYEAKAESKKAEKNNLEKSKALQGKAEKAGKDTPRGKQLTEEANIYAAIADAHHMHTEALNNYAIKYNAYQFQNATLSEVSKAKTEADGTGRLVARLEKQLKGLK